MVNTNWGWLELARPGSLERWALRRSGAPNRRGRCRENRLERPSAHVRMACIYRTLREPLLPGNTLCPIRPTLNILDEFSHVARLAVLHCRVVPYLTCGVA